MADKFVLRLKKWMLLFVILVVPYLIVQVVENSTHKILSLGYLERTILDMDSLNNPYEKLDSARVPSFKLINQDQQYVTSQDLIGTNYVVNFFFTSCPTICPSTTLNLIELQKKINNYGIDDFKILSISIDPNNDTPQKLKQYAVSMGVDLSNWELLTGSKEEIYNIVQSGFHLPVGQDSLAPGGLFHSPSVSIVDSYGYIRTGLDKKKNIKFVYDGTLYSDIKLLVGEIQRLSITQFKDNYDIEKR
mgnify:CR=1 FL=1